MAATHRSGKGRKVGKRLLLVLAMALGALPLLQGVALAHHAEVSAAIDCDSVVTFTARAWAGSGTPGSPRWIESRTNTDIRVWYTVDGGPQVTVRDGEGFNEGNDFQFSGSFQAPATGTIRVFAQAEANWANGASGGGVWDTGALTRPTNCGQPDVTVVKSSNMTDVVPGEQFTYTLTAQNIGNATATNVQIVDSIPASLTIISIPGNCSAAGNTVTCNLGTLTAGASASVSFTVETTNDSCPKVDNFGTVTASNEPPASTGNNTSNTVTVNVSCTEPDVTVVKSSSAATVNAGGSVTFTIEAENTGTAQATNVVITDTIPAGLTITGTSAGCTVNGQTVTCSIGTLDPGQKKSITITVTATEGACPAVNNQASVSAANEPGANTGNNLSNTVTLNVICPTPDVEIRKHSDAPDAGVFVGGEFTYTITVENVSAGDAHDVVIHDTIPAGLTIVSVSSPCTVSGQSVTCALGTVPAGATVHVTITVRAEDAACPEVTNRATVTSSDDGNPDNNTSDPVTVIVNCEEGEIEVEIVKTNDANGDGRYTDFEEAKQEGQDVSFRLLITNTGPEAWTITDLSDVFEQSVIDLLDGKCSQLDGITLDPGESVKCIFTVRNYAPPAEETLLNIVEVCVEMVGDSGVTDCDDDSSRVRSAEVLGRTVTPPPTRTPPGGTAFTGPYDDTIRYGMLALALLLLGTGVMYAGYRRRATDDH